MPFSHYPFQTMAGKKTSYFVDLLTATGAVPSSWVQKLKSLRLEALRSNPSSYLSTFAREEELTDDQWSERILHPRYHYLICHTPRVPATDTALGDDASTPGWEENDDWVGMFLLLGPYQKDEYGAAPLLDSTALGPDKEEARWHLTALYLQPDSRCADSAIAIHEAILAYLRFWTDDHLETTFDHVTGLEKPKRARVVGQLRGENDPLAALYEGLAWKTVGWAGGVVGRRIAGLEDYPGEEPMHEVRVRVMERIIEC